MAGSTGTLVPMIADYPEAPPRLAPFLAQWDYMSEQLLLRLDGLTDEELVWEPAAKVLTVRRQPDGKTRTDAHGLPPDASVQPPRTLAWSIGHLGAGSLVRADWLTGSHSLDDESVEWGLVADDAVALLGRGLSAWRDGLGQMTDADLDTVGRSAYPRGLDPQLPLLDIVWWVNKELVEHAAEIWYVRDLYAASR
jgi:DinB family protein